MHDENFEWDDGKAAENEAKHGVTFDMAREVFQDSFAIDIDDRSSAYGEDRFLIIGTVDGRLLTVAYTMRGETIRIISARSAAPYERRMYHEENKA
ncbi:BrnT family toxin [Vineibacter terrae]|uniref:BrnT family toxin n=1 Tax=Vineibacter terrae TaxID=2586908 RepID=A0A5C8PCP7_9HYPH|nr:BrnT family toxin [Vineibacter terrae]TXL71121.1 BrnT family toxin [Vineibacter terrae]